VVDRVDAVRQPELLERPLHAQVARLADDLSMDPAEAVERDHPILLTQAVADRCRQCGWFWLGHAAAVCARSLAPSIHPDSPRLDVAAAAVRDEVERPRHARQGKLA
jgi:hypothetical protein